jgi:uncharacterized OB-fold protein
VLTAEGGPATLSARSTWSHPQLDRYRGADEPATRDTYDARLTREHNVLPGVAEVAARLNQPSPDAWVLPDHDGRLGRSLAKAAGAEPGRVAGGPAGIGYPGAAAALLAAVSAMAEPGVIAVLAHGGSRTSGITITVTEPPPGAGPPPLGRHTVVSYPQVLRARGQLVASGEPVPMAVPPGSAAFTRAGAELLRLLAVRCDKCGTLATPPSTHPTCLSCGVPVATIVPLARTGEVHTFVVNSTMPAPFVAPLPLAVIDLDGGGRIMLQVTGPAADLAIGDRVDLVLRRYVVERGAPVYGYKARRAEGS